MIPTMSDQESVTGARLQNNVVRPDSRQDERNGGEIDGRRELLPFDLLFAAHRLGGQTVEQVAGRADIGERTQRIGTELEMVGKRVLENREPVVLRPYAIGIGAAKAGAHRSVEIGAGNARSGYGRDEKNGGQEG